MIVNQMHMKLDEVYSLLHTAKREQFPTHELYVEYLNELSNISNQLNNVVQEYAETLEKLQALGFEYKTLVKRASKPEHYEFEF